MTKLLIKMFISNADEVTNPKVRERYGALSSVVGIVCNVLLFIVKFLMGTISGSIAVTSDAFNNLSDCLSCGVTYVSYKLAAKPADSDHPFGHGRIEYLASLFIAVLILMVGVEFLQTSFDKIINPTPINYSHVVVASLVVSVLVKLWLHLFNKELGTITKSSSMLATSQDSLSDALITTVTTVSLVLSLFVDFPIDGFMGLIVSFLILKAGYGIVKDTVDTLLGQPADEETISEILDIVYSYDVTLGVHDVIVHNYGPGHMIASLHVEFDSKYEILAAHDQIDCMEKELYEKLGILTSIHMDPIETDNELLKEKREFVERIINKVNPRLSMHDFRMVVGETHTNLIFDVVLPHELADKSKDVKKQIDAEIQAVYPDHFTVITFDMSFSKFEHK